MIGKIMGIGFQLKKLNKEKIYDDNGNGGGGGDDVVVDDYEENLFRP